MITMSLRPQKRTSCSEDDVGRDRLSEMPDEIIVNILSCLPTVDAVRTVLFRRFGNLWTLVHTLNLNIDDFSHVDQYGGPDDIEPFYVFVRNVLMLHKSLSVDKFHVKTLWKSYDETKIWLRFALDRQAKEIIFCDVSWFYISNSSPLSNFTSQSLVTLELDGCIITPQLHVHLGSLRKLVLCNVSICEVAFQQFLSGCPHLEELFIENPWGIRKLSFGSPKIHKLSLVLTDSGTEEFLLVDFPNLRCLDLGIDLIPYFINVSSLRDVKIKEFLGLNDEEDHERFQVLLGKFEGVEVLKVSRNALEQFLHPLHEFDLLQVRWKRVVLQLPRLCESCLLGISELLRSLKHLEEVIIHTTLTRTNELEFVKRVSTFERAPAKAKVFFA